MRLTVNRILVSVPFPVSVALVIGIDNFGVCASLSGALPRSAMLSAITTAGLRSERVNAVGSAFSCPLLLAGCVLLVILRLDCIVALVPVAAPWVICTPFAALSFSWRHCPRFGGTPCRNGAADLPLARLPGCRHARARPLPRRDCAALRGRRPHGREGAGFARAHRGVALSTATRCGDPGPGPGCAFGPQALGAGCASPGRRYPRSVFACCWLVRPQLR